MSGLKDALLTFVGTTMLVGAAVLLSIKFPATDDRYTGSICIGAEACADQEKDMISHGYSKIR